MRYELMIGIDHSFSGGCFPNRTRISRKATSFFLFNFRTATVARPAGVVPIIRIYALLQIKWSLQFWVRGLKRGTINFVIGSTAFVLLYLQCCLLEAFKALWDANSTPVCWGCQEGIPIYSGPVTAPPTLAGLVSHVYYCQYILSLHVPFPLRILLF